MVVVRMSATSGMLRSSAIWQNGSTLITPPDKASKRLFETRFSRKSGARLSASIRASRPPAPRRGDHLRRLADRAKEVDLQTSDHAAPGDRRRAHEVRLTAGRRENFRCLAAEGYQLRRVQPKWQGIVRLHQR